MLFAEGSQVSPAEHAPSVAVHLHTLFVESQNMPVVAVQELSDEVHLQVPESQYSPVVIPTQVDPDPHTQLFPLQVSPTGQGFSLPLHFATEKRNADN